MLLSRSLPSLLRLAGARCKQSPLKREGCVIIYRSEAREGTRHSDRLQIPPTRTRRQFVEVHSMPTSVSAAMFLLRICVSVYVYTYLCF